MTWLFRSSLLVSLASVLAAGCGTSGCGASSTRGAQSHPSVTAETPAAHAPAAHAPAAQMTVPAHLDPDGTQPAPPPPAGLAVATFAGGCFWCMEYAFEHLNGVRDAISGYAGGSEVQPSYEDVSNHRTTHAESVRVLYDPAVVTYEQLLDLYWHRVDATDRDAAFADQGHQYRAVIFVHSPEQRAAAERSKRQIEASGRFGEPILVTIEDAPVFWVAEAYHQNFWRTTPDRFNAYHEHSGRREYLRAHWGPDAPY